MRVSGLSDLFTSNNMIMLVLNITEDTMIADINSELCGKLEAWTCSLEFPFDTSRVKVFTYWWKHPNVGDYVKINEAGQCLLGFPGDLFTHGYHYCDKPVCHPWLKEQDEKYPGFIEKVWLHIKLQDKL